MMKDEKIKEAQQSITDGNVDVPGQITSVKGNWGVWDVITTSSMAKQFIGRYRYDAFTSKDGKYLNNVISDSKSMSSFFIIYILVIKIPIAANRKYLAQHISSIFGKVKIDNYENKTVFYITIKHIVFLL